MSDLPEVAKAAIIACFHVLEDHMENKLRLIIRDEMKGGQANEPEKPINVELAAEHVSLDVQTVYRLLRSGDIPAHKKSSRWYFFKSELNEWIRTK